jgi:hypothetical protein
MYTDLIHALSFTLVNLSSFDHRAVNEASVNALCSIISHNFYLTRRNVPSVPLISSFAIIVSFKTQNRRVVYFALIETWKGKLSNLFRVYLL